MGIVIGETATVGDGCLLYKGVVLGGTSLERKVRHPQIGDNVVIGSNACILGNIHVGNHARIGSGSVVVREVPAEATVVGVPARIVVPKHARFDAALDHRAPDFKAQLAAATPDGIDVYFENVGGHVWEAVLPRLNTYARIPVCGLVAHYNDTELPPGPDRSSALMSAILRKSLTVRGFIQNEFVDSLMGEFLSRATGWVQDGSLKYCEDIVDGLENAPEAFIGMLEGKNFGKLIIKVS